MLVKKFPDVKFQVQDIMKPVRDEYPTKIHENKMALHLLTNSYCGRHR